MLQKTSLKEIASLAGVSIATVSRVLSNTGPVKESTRQKVLEAFEKNKNREFQHKTNMVALVVPDVLNQFFPLLLKGIECVSRSQGYNLVLCNSEGSVLLEEKILLNLLEVNVDGIIIVGAGEPTASMRRIISEHFLPVVFLDRDPGIKDINVITTNNTEGMRQSAKYLLSLGHQRILYIGGPPNVSTEAERYCGFARAISEAGIPLSGIGHIHGDYLKMKVYQEISSMNDAGQFPYTAICSSNDLMAFGAYQALIEHNVRIPEDVSIIGYDDIPTASLVRLTTIRQPLEEMGRTAMMMLHSTICDPYSPVSRKVLDGGLVVRDSCKVPKQNSPD